MIIRKEVQPALQASLLNSWGCTVTWDHRQGDIARCRRHQIVVASHSYFVPLVAYLKAGGIVMCFHHSSHFDIPTACLYGWLPLSDAYGILLHHLMADHHIRNILSAKNTAPACNPPSLRDFCYAGLFAGIGLNSPFGTLLQRARR